MLLAVRARARASRWVAAVRGTLDRVLRALRVLRAVSCAAAVPLAAVSADLPDRPVWLGQADLQLSTLVDQRFGSLDVVTDGGFAYVISEDDGTLSVFETGDPAGPRLLRRLTHGESAVGDALDGVSGLAISRLKASTLAFLTLSWGNGFSIVDVSDGSRPVVKSRLRDGEGGFQLLSGAVRVAVDGTRAYVVAHGNGPKETEVDHGLTIIDVSEPERPKPIWEIRNGRDGFDRLLGASSVAVTNDLAFVTSFVDSALTIIDVSSTAGPPRLLGTSPREWGLFGAKDVVLSDGRAYLALEQSDGVAIIDVRDPVKPLLVTLVRDGDFPGGFQQLASPQRIAVTDGLAWVTSTRDSAVTVMDVRNPSAPALVAEIGGCPGYFQLGGALGLAVADGRAWVTARADGALTSLRMSSRGAAVQCANVGPKWSVPLTNSAFPFGVPTTFQVQLWAGDAPGELKPMHCPVAVGSRGLFNAGVVTLPAGIAATPRDPLYGEVRAWDGVSAASYASAAADPVQWIFRSHLLTLTNLPAGDFEVPGQLSDSGLDGFRARPPVTWGARTRLQVGEALGPDQLNATSPVPGRFTYVPPAGTVFADPTNVALSVTFIPGRTNEFEPVTRSVMLEIRNRKAQVIMGFPTTGTAVFGQGPIPLVATATSGLPVTFKVVQGPGTKAARELWAPTGAGVVLLAAMQGGDEFWLPADDVFQTVTVARAAQTIRFDAPAEKVLGDPPFLVDASASSGLPVALQVVLGPAMLQANRVSLSDTGTVFLAARQAGDANYEPAPTVTRSIVVTAATPGTPRLGIWQPQVGRIGLEVSGAIPETSLEIQFLGPANPAVWLLLTRGTTRADGRFSYTDTEVMAEAVKLYRVRVP